MRAFAAALSLALAAARTHPAPGRYAPLETAGGGTLPHWAPTYDMARSTILQPCNTSGWFDPELAGRYGVIDFDWSNAKQLWANTKPMDCEERLITQAAMVKAVNPDTKVFVYRNLVKALPWYTSVWQKLADPQYAGWFLPFSGANNYHVPACDDTYSPPLCSNLYHDQDQTPRHPHGDGSCVDLCDCGGVPCGECACDLWDHRNASLRAYLLNEFILGPTGLRNDNVSGFYFDDGWADSPQPIAPWMPKEGFCDHSPIGGATEEDLYCSADMGLTQADTTAIKAAWQQTMTLVTQAVTASGAFYWQGFAQTSLPGPGDAAACAAWFETPRQQVAYVHQMTNATVVPWTAVAEDVAAFLIVRGPYAWIGSGWIGCAESPASYPFPDEWRADYGEPLAPFTRTGNTFSREWSKATATFDCDAWKGTVTMK